MHSNRTGLKELLGDTPIQGPSRTKAFVSAAGKSGLAVMLVLGTALVVAFTSALFAGDAASLSTVVVVAAGLLVAVSLQIASPGFRHRWRSILANGAPVLPNPFDFRDPHLLGLVQRLDRARRARSAAASASPYGPCHALSRSQVAIAAVEQRAVVVAARAEFVSTSLAELSDCRVQADGDIVRLESAEQQALCPESSAAYHGAAVWAAERRASVRHLESRRAALVATLEHLVAILESMPAKATDLELRRIEESDRVLNETTVDAEDELAQLDAVFS